MYCPNCGKEIESSQAFCDECGFNLNEYFKDQQDTQTDTPAEAISAPNKEQTQMQSNTTANKLKAGNGNNSSKDTFDSIVPGGCIILTNIALLAKKFKVNTLQIKELLESFVEIKRQAGIAYFIIDAGDYTYKTKKGFFSSKKVSLDIGSDIGDYMDILMDFVSFKEKSKDNVPENLFIIGGNDIIPMPKTKNYVPLNEANKTIDSDILYSFPYGNGMVDELEKQEIFKYDQMFHIGRLPFAKDSTLDDLFNYLQRDIDHTYGIKMGEIYAQCDPNWKNVTVKVSRLSYIDNLMRNFDGRISEEYYYNRVILSPMVLLNNINQIFHPSATLYYYNLHGGNKAKYYFGVPLKGDSAVPVLSPEYMAACATPNVVVSEACYGARFIELNKSESMLLSSLSANTLNFVGSSRVSWGNVDSDHATPENTGICCADTLAYRFMQSLLKGYTMGEAMFIARNEVLSSSNVGDLKAALTVVEFNLFGDPTLFVIPDDDATEDSKNATAKHIKPQAYIEKNTPLSYKVEEVKTDKSNDSLSILQQVRNAVDANIAQIHDTIGTHLYKTYGISPRPASNILKIKYGDGREEYDFMYEVSGKESEEEIYYSVTASPSGTILSLQSSK